MFNGGGGGEQVMSKATKIVVATIGLSTVIIIGMIVGIALS